MINRAHLVEVLESAFPNLSQEFHDETWDGLLHLQVAIFARFTQEVIDAQDADALRRCFELAAKFMLQGDEEVDNAMHVSYLEHLDLSNGPPDRTWALRQMPDPLLDGYRRVHGYRGA
jgi:hypothetical protein